MAGSYLKRRNRRTYNPNSARTRQHSNNTHNNTPNDTPNNTPTTPLATHQQPGGVQHREAVGLGPEVAKVVGVELASAGAVRPIEPLSRLSVFGFFWTSTDAMGSSHISHQHRHESVGGGGYVVDVWWALRSSQPPSPLPLFVSFFLAGWTFSCRSSCSVPHFPVLFVPG